MGALWEPATFCRTYIHVHTSVRSSRHSWYDGSIPIDLSSPMLPGTAVVLCHKPTHMYMWTCMITVPLDLNLNPNLNSSL